MRQVKVYYKMDGFHFFLSSNNILDVKSSINVIFCHPLVLCDRWGQQWSSCILLPTWKSMKVWWFVSVIPSPLSLCQSIIFGELLCQVDWSEEGGFIGETLCRRRPTEGELVCQRDCLASADHFVLFVWESVCLWETLTSPVILRRVSKNWVLLAFFPSTPKSSMKCCKLFL